MSIRKMPPRLKVEEHYSGGMRKKGSKRPTYKETICSECEGVLHPTARFCIHCGAWFSKKKGKKA